MKTSFSISTLILASLIFSGCGSGGTSVSEESFVAGDGVVTFVAKENRSLAPDINGESLLGEEIFIEKVYNQSFGSKPYIIDCGANIGLSIIYFKSIARRFSI